MDYTESMRTEPLTYRLKSGLVVLAKLYHGEPYPVTYANWTQATRAVERLGKDWFVAHDTSRPFYAAMKVSIWNRA